MHLDPVPIATTFMLIRQLSTDEASKETVVHTNALVSEKNNCRARLNKDSHHQSHA